MFKVVCCRIVVWGKGLNRWTRRHNLNNLGKGPQDNATTQINQLYTFLCQARRFSKSIPVYLFVKRLGQEDFQNCLIIFLLVTMAIRDLHGINFFEQFWKGITTRNILVEFHAMQWPCNLGDAVWCLIKWARNMRNSAFPQYFQMLLIWTFEFPDDNFFKADKT